ncbi:hypothetical protein [Hymenobacter canadensis]|uniref:Uncharacterized protein n=1 Tax=Hymenobacter canadensis TaxID=2999067 RepID=A0ABY7LY54_9BACT|nr:hypothetical protein [Hymenobacter canadensis]WBA44332.1 hypothetical protein O3303_21230 [Hymenobacter canadensis]
MLLMYLGAHYEFVLAVTDAKVAVKAHVHEPVIAAPAVGMKHRGNVYFEEDASFKVFFEQSGAILV